MQKRSGKKPPRDKAGQKAKAKRVAPKRGAGARATEPAAKSGARTRDAKGGDRARSRQTKAKAAAKGVATRGTGRRTTPKLAGKSTTSAKPKGARPVASRVPALRAEPPRPVAWVEDGFFELPRPSAGLPVDEEPVLLPIDDRTAFFSVQLAEATWVAATRAVAQPEVQVRLLEGDRVVREVAAAPLRVWVTFDRLQQGHTYRADAWAVGKRGTRRRLTRGTSALCWGAPSAAVGSPAHRQGVPTMAPAAALRGPLEAWPAQDAPRVVPAPVSGASSSWPSSGPYLSGRP